MLSILIPVYNWDVTQLALDLLDQCRRAGIVFEIRCYEDGSSEAERRKNEKLGGYEGVVYRVFRENQGRARIRNLLAADARFPYLLFLDGDSGVVDDDFIRNYLGGLRAGAILYGGRIYSPERPERSSLLLHWQYGHRRETAPACRRQFQPYERFMTNNFLIPRDIFLRIGFDERLVQYGHEDTLFGHLLRALAIPIVHLDNPVVHLGLEEAGFFLKKNRQAMENLCFLYRQYPGLDTRLLRTARRLQRGRLKGVVRIVLLFLLPALRRNLRSRRPSLRALDLYKLYYFLHYDQRRTV